MKSVYANVPVLDTGARGSTVIGEGRTSQAGISLKTSAFESGGPNMIQALSSGTLDVYVAGLAPLLVARSNGIDVRVSQRRW